MSLEEIARTLNRIEDEVHTIKRGIYGDEPNHVKGLIKTDAEQEERIVKLEDARKKTLWMIGGGLLVIEAVMQIAKFKFGL